MKALTWSLLHFLWQGAAIGALAAAAMSLFRESTTRYLIGVGALALMFASFGVTFALLSVEQSPVGDIVSGARITAVMSPGGAVSIFTESAVLRSLSTPPESVWDAEMLCTPALSAGAEIVTVEPEAVTWAICVVPS